MLFFPYTVSFPGGTCSKALFTHRVKHIERDGSQKNEVQTTVVSELQQYYNSVWKRIMVSWQIDRSSHIQSAGNQLHNQRPYSFCLAFNHSHPLDSSYETHQEIDTIAYYYYTSIYISSVSDFSRSKFIKCIFLKNARIKIWKFTHSDILFWFSKGSDSWWVKTYLELAKVNPVLSRLPYTSPGGLCSHTKKTAPELAVLNCHCFHSGILN